MYNLNIILLQRGDDMINITNIKSEIDLQTKHPHVKTQVCSNIKTYVKMNLENELYYQQNGKYPDGTVECKIPEDISERAIEIEERLIK